MMTLDDLFHELLHAIMAKDWERGNELADEIIRRLRV